jgi:hypothetical protein
MFVSNPKDLKKFKESIKIESQDLIRLSLIVEYVLTNSNEFKIEENKRQEIIQKYKKLLEAKKFYLNKVLSIKNTLEKFSE